MCKVAGKVRGCAVLFKVVELLAGQNNTGFSND